MAFSPIASRFEWKGNAPVQVPGTQVGNPHAEHAKVQEINYPEKSEHRL